MRGKKLTIEDGESRWINFKYERLPNFYYRCGMLNHALKECPEKAVDNNQATEVLIVWIMAEGGTSKEEWVGNNSDQAPWECQF